MQISFYNSEIYETVLWIPTVFLLRSRKQHRGICRDIPKCENPNEIFWPQNGRCYERLTKGPCTKGQLITVSSDGSAVCACNHKKDMIDYFYNGYGCFQHFTKGPCKEKGHLFLPDRSCDCTDELPHFHDVTKQCFEIGNTNFDTKFISLKSDNTLKIKKKFRNFAVTSSPPSGYQLCGLV